MKIHYRTKYSIYFLASMLLGPFIGRMMKLEPLPTDGNVFNAVTIVAAVAVLVIVVGYFVPRLHLDRTKEVSPRNFRYRNPISDALVTGVSCVGLGLGCLLGLRWVDSMSAWFVFLSIGCGCLLGALIARSIRPAARS